MISQSVYPMIDYVMKLLDKKIFNDIRKKIFKLVSDVIIIYLVILILDNKVILTPRTSVI